MVKTFTNSPDQRLNSLLSVNKDSIQLASVRPAKSLNQAQRYYYRRPWVDDQREDLSKSAQVIDKRTYQLDETYPGWAIILRPLTKPMVMFIVCKVRLLKGN